MVVPADKLVSQVYKDLMKVSAMHESKRMDLDKLQRYIVLSYSGDSPVFKSYRDVGQRKMEAFRLAGYEVAGETYAGDTNLEGIANLDIDAVAEMVLQYMAVTQPRAIQQIMIYEQTYYEYSLQLIKKTSGKSKAKGITTLDSEVISAMTNKSKLLDALDRISDKIDSAYEKLSSGDKALEDAIHNAIRWTPEGVAEMVNRKGIKII